MAVSYTFDQWSALVSAVENQGGALLPDNCEGQLLTFKEKETGKVTKARTCHCDNESIFVTVYDPAESDEAARPMQERGGGFARVCGVCDYVGAWPRFEHVMKEEDE